MDPSVLSEHETLECSCSATPNTAQVPSWRENETNRPPPYPQLTATVGAGVRWDTEGKWAYWIKLSVTLAEICWKRIK
jgi:hypothetical protein